MFQQQKKMFKIMAAIERKNGTYWIRCGTGFENKDASINVVLDCVPKDYRFTIRELDPEDLRRIDERKASRDAPVGPRDQFDASAPRYESPPPAASAEPLPF